MPNDKVLLIGDSLMQGLAPHLIARFNKKHQITIVDMSRHSTGLTYPAFYNWPEAVTLAFAQQNFDINFGATAPNSDGYIASGTPFTATIPGTDTTLAQTFSFVPLESFSFSLNTD